MLVTAVVVVALVAGAGLVTVGRGVRSIFGSDGDVRRALLVGDSLLYGAGLQMAQKFSEHGVTVDFVGGPGTGPLDDQSWWLAAISLKVRTFKPDVVVIEACCNYDIFGLAPFRLSDGSTLQADTPRFYEQWERASRDAVERASSDGARVFWVITPPADPVRRGGGPYPARIERLNAIYRKLPDVTLVDWRRVLAPDGRFTPTVRSGGEELRVRKDDGLHITADGSRLIAEETWRQVAATTGAG